MTRLNRDVLSGLVFIAIGSAGLWLGQDYPVGTAFRMGAGYFPRVLCSILALIGLIVAVLGLIRGGEPPGSMQLKPLVLITLSTVAFGALITTAGLGPACLAVVLIGALAGPEFKLLEALLLAVILTAGAVGLFIYALGMPLAIFANPFA